MNEGARQENARIAQQGLQGRLDSIARKLDRLIELIESHGPTLRAPDQAAIELLRKLRNEHAIWGGYISPDLLQEIDAVLKAAAGG